MKALNRLIARPIISNPLSLPTSSSHLSPRFPYSTFPRPFARARFQTPYARYECKQQNSRLAVGSLEKRWRTSAAAARKEVEEEEDPSSSSNSPPAAKPSAQAVASPTAFKAAKNAATSPIPKPSSRSYPFKPSKPPPNPSSSSSTSPLPYKSPKRPKPSISNRQAPSIPESTLLPFTSRGEDEPDLFGFHLQNEVGDGSSWGGEVEADWQGRSNFDTDLDLDLHFGSDELEHLFSGEGEETDHHSSPSISSGEEIEFDPLYNLLQVEEIAEAASEYARSMGRGALNLEVGGGMGDGRGRKAVGKGRGKSGSEERLGDAREVKETPKAKGGLLASMGKKVTDTARASTATTFLPEDHNHSFLQTPFPPQSRFDWRQRATSRLKADDPRKRVFKFRDLRKNALGTGDGLWKKEVGAYTDKWLSLLNLEQQAATSQAEERLKRSSKEVLVWQGFCLDKLGGMWEKPKFASAGAAVAGGGQAKVKGRRVAVFANSGKKGTSGFRWNRLQPGAVVRLSKDSTDFQDRTTSAEDDDDSKPMSASEPIITGTVNRQEIGKIFVTLEGDIQDLEKELWRLDLWISDIVLRRSVEALASLNHDPVATDIEGVKRDATLREAMAASSPSPVPDLDDYAGGASPTLKPLPARKIASTEPVLLGTALRDIIVGPLGKTAAAQAKPEDQGGMFGDDMLIMSWCRRHLRKGTAFLPAEGDPDVKLNESQKRAIALMLSRRLSLIQGPPGTGKTRTIIEALHLLKAHWQVSVPILVTGYTNTAVDNLAEGLRQRKLKILRYGAASRIREDLQPVSLEGYLERHPKKRTLDMIKQKLALLPRTPEAANERLKLRNRLFGIERYMMQVILNNVCATCISAVSGLLQMIDFPVVFLDEASMATEPASLIPLTKGCAHLAIIGDQKQLPPVILSQDAKDRGLALSLFERLMKHSASDHRLPSSLLDTQYRMHPVISAYPNKAFYEGKLQDGTVLADGSIRPDLVAPTTAFLDPSGQGSFVPMTFIDHASPEKPHMGSINNVGEVDIVASIVVDILQSNPHVNVADIGIISPYSAQVMALQQLLHDPGKAAMWADLIGQKRIENLSNLEISTVDGFEGREKRIIIFSTTRSNPRFAIGFLEDNRRLNVALTRAQAAMIIVGNARTLRNAESFASSSQGGVRAWHRLIAHLSKRKLVIPYETDITTQQSQQQL